MWIKKGEHFLSQFFLWRKRLEHDTSRPIRILHSSDDGQTIAHFKEVHMLQVGLIRVCCRNFCLTYRKRVFLSIRVTKLEITRISFLWLL